MTSAPCMWMRGGTSKRGYFLKSDLPADTADRDKFLLAVMGSPDPLTSKVAVVSKSVRDGIDVDYLFLQAFVDKPWSPTPRIAALCCRASARLRWNAALLQPPATRPA